MESGRESSKDATLIEAPSFGNLSDNGSLLTSAKDILASLDLETMLVHLAGSLESLIKVDGISLKLLAATEEVLLIREGDRFRKKIIYASKILNPGGFASEALETGTPIAIEDVTSCRFSLPAYLQRESFRSLIAIPLISRARKIGVLTIYFTECTSPSRSVLSILSIVASVTAAAIENSELVRRIEKNYFSTVEALAAAIEAKDPYTRGHSKRVTQYAIALAERFGISEIDRQNLQYGATLHDIGKIGVRGNILNKRERLTPHEYEIIKQHPIIGERIIERVDFLQGAKPVIRSHHERFDGTGYPDGLRDEEIPFLARIVAVVDFFDALTSHRPYRKAYSPEETIMFIKQEIGRSFDPVVAKEFIEMNIGLLKSDRKPELLPTV